MSLSMHALAVGSFAPMLGALSRVLDKSAAHARDAKVDLAKLVGARLAPDMFTLRQQVQLACHHARDAVVRLTGGEGKPAEDIGDRFEDLKDRIAQTLAFLEATPESAFAGAAERHIVLPMQGTPIVFEMKGAEFLRDWALPHFYFHVVTAYDLCRHVGVPIGKPDYMGGVGKYIRRPAG